MNDQQKRESTIETVSEVVRNNARCSRDVEARHIAFLVDRKVVLVNVAADYYYQTFRNKKELEAIVAELLQFKDQLPEE